MVSEAIRAKASGARALTLLVPLRESDVRIKELPQIHQIQSVELGLRHGIAPLFSHEAGGNLGLLVNSHLGLGLGLEQKHTHKIHEIPTTHDSFRLCRQLADPKVDAAAPTWQTEASRRSFSKMTVRFTEGRTSSREVDPQAIPLVALPTAAEGQPLRRQPVALRQSGRASCPAGPPNWALKILTMT